MRTPRQYLAERFPWLTLVDSLAAAFLVVLLIVLIWPNSPIIRDLVFLTAIPGSIGAILWGLTFWPKARIQLGRLKFRYKSVRRYAGIVALACLPFLLLQQASLYLSGPNILREQPPLPELAQAYPNMDQSRIRVVVAIAHLEGDDGRKIESQLRDALANLDSRLHVTPVILNRTIKASGRPQGVAHLDALNSVTDVRVDALIWGGVNDATHPAVAPLYETRFGNDPQFGGVYLPADFKLPALPPDELCKVVCLIVATHAAESTAEWDMKFGDALQPLIAQTRAIVDDPRRSSNWTPDTRARVNLALGIASRTSGDELKSEDLLNAAVAYLQRTQHDWTRESDPDHWAEAQLSLATTLNQLAVLNGKLATVQASVAAYKNALAVYQARSDKIDSGTAQLQLGNTFQQLATHETGLDSLRQAVEYCRAAVKNIDVNFYPMSWAAAQAQLGTALTSLADRDDNADGFQDAITAYKEALKVYTKRANPMLWADIQIRLAEALQLLGADRSNVDDLKQSIAISRQVLDGFPRAWDRKRWAGIQARLGNELLSLNDIQPDPSFPQQAVVAFRASLEEQSRERDPIAWAVSKALLGNAFAAMGDSSNNTDYFLQAIDSYKDALNIFTPDSSPVQWARTKSDLGDALTGLGIRGPGVKYLEQAVDNYRQALTVLTKDKLPGDWKKTQNNLEVALDALHQRGWTGS